MTWWPLAAGILVTFAAVKTAEILPLMGPSGLFRLRLLYPFAMLLKQPHLGVSEAAADHWSQIALFAQFPAYGLYAGVAAHWKPLWRSLLEVAFVHLLAFSALWLLASS